MGLPDGGGTEEEAEGEKAEEMELTTDSAALVSSSTRPEETGGAEPLDGVAGAVMTSEGTSGVDWLRVGRMGR